MIEVLAAPLVACLILTSLHCYLGIHVLLREVIFVDLALAQVAAMGMAVGVWAGHMPGSAASYAFSLGFTFAGAAIFALGPFRDRRVPQEAVIGIVYAVSSALAILVLSRTALDRAEIEHMLAGRLLFLAWPEVGHMAMIYAAAALLYTLLGRQILAISLARGTAGGLPRRARLIDFVFYCSFGVVVTCSVRVAGVLLVFGYLVVPAACAAIFLSRFRDRLLAGWAVGLAASAAGLGASALLDLPTAMSIVVALGAFFALAAAVKVIFAAGPAGRTGFSFRSSARLPFTRPRREPTELWRPVQDRGPPPPRA